MRNLKMRFSYLSCQNIVSSLYLFVVLGFLPLFYKYQYADMGDAKYNIFLRSSILYVLILFLFLFFQFIWKIKKEGIQKWKETLKLDFSLLDQMVLLYFGCTTISFLLSSFKEGGLWGVAGWNMGYISQILFVAVYFLISRRWKFHQGFLWLLMASSQIAFLVAILHRFDVDILHIYGDLKLAYKIQFLSTIGQSSWYSSFLCTVFPMGLYLFFISDRKGIRITSGIYSILSMCTLVTQNTDSAFLSLFFVLLLFFYLSFDSQKEGRRFCEVLMVVFGSFTFMGICQRIFSERIIPLDSLSIFMSQSALSQTLLVAVVLIYILFGKKSKISLAEKKTMAKVKQHSRKIFWILAAAIGVGIIVMIFFILLNSTGILYTHFGYQNVNNYLLFADNWGNQRGFAWRYTCEVYSELPFLRKMIGVGPDCYAFYMESIPKYVQQMEEFWGGLILTNAHNEYLTKLLNLGLLGLASYLFMLGSAVFLFIKGRREHILLPAFALCTISYMTHNIFCYEQVCCTPFFYILLGFGSNLIHNKIQKSTY